MQAAIVNKEAAQELARTIVRERGIEFSPPSSDQLRRPARHRYGRITRHAPGHVVAEVLNDTGEVRRFELKRTDDGSINVEEL